MKKRISKKFISAISLQAKPEDSVKTLYDIDRSCYFSFDRATRNPILPFIYNNAQKDEIIGVYLIKYPFPQVETHTALFVEELREMEKEIGFTAEITYLNISAARDNRAYLLFVKELFNVIEDHDIIFMDITFGEKPLPILQSLVLTYAQNVRKDVEIGALSYGAYYGNNSGMLYDYTVIPLLSKFIVNVADMNDPEKMLNNLMEGFIGEENGHGENHEG